MWLVHWVTQGLTYFSTITMRFLCLFSIKMPSDHMFLFLQGLASVHSSVSTRGFYLHPLLEKLRLAAVILVSVPQILPVLVGAVGDCIISMKKQIKLEGIFFLFFFTFPRFSFFGLWDVVVHLLHSGDCGCVWDSPDFQHQQHPDLLDSWSRRVLYPHTPPSDCSDNRLWWHSQPHNHGDI